MILEIKPFSVNKAWKGKRYRTDEYRCYQKEVLYSLPKLKIDFKKKLIINFVFGFSNSASDIDNPIKPILDIMQKKYLFDDKQVYEMNIKKEVVKKGKEFIKFQISEL